MPKWKWLYLQPIEVPASDLRISREVEPGHAGVGLGGPQVRHLLEVWRDRGEGEQGTQDALQLKVRTLKWGTRW